MAYFPAAPLIPGTVGNGTLPADLAFEFENDGDPSAMRAALERDAHALAEQPIREELIRAANDLVARAPVSPVVKN